jgi:NitT/TauT family transport system permease protein
VAAAGFGALGVLALAALWDLYKFLGPEAGVKIGDTLVLPRTTDMAMPHSWDMVIRLFEPVNSMPGSPYVWQAVLDASLFTLRISALGWVIGVAIGFALALVMSRWRTAEAGLLPWVVLSQTVPLIAIAPLVRRWGSQIRIGDFVWTNEHSVALIAAYLAFFTVAVGGLRGLKSPQTTHLELMHAYGVGWWRTLVTLRLPSSVPYVLPALRLAAAAAVIGAVVAEVSIGLRGGIGRMVVEYAQSASGDPAKAWAPIFGAVFVGLVAAGAVGLIGLALRPFKLTGATS